MELLYEDKRITIADVERLPVRSEVAGGVRPSEPAKKPEWFPQPLEQAQARSKPRRKP
jgi:hypothetical protein